MVDTPSFSTIYAFGDSLSDAGNVSIVTNLIGTPEPVSPPYFGEDYGAISAAVFSNGPTWVQDLSQELGLGILAPALAGGTDFAFGGAETGPTPVNPTTPETAVIDLPAQLQDFATRVPSPSADALYTLWIGGTDLTSILAQPSLTPQLGLSYVADSVANEINAVNTLIGDGARNLLVVDVPDIGKVPEITSLGDPQLDMLGTSLSAAYNVELNGSLQAIAQADAVTIGTLDSFALLDAAIADPAQYGYSNVADPVWSGNFTDPNSGTLAAADPVQQNRFLFWDHIHPTESGHLLIAQAALAALPCFAAGTRIAAERGDVPVEDLRVGDLIRTALGSGWQPIVWTGHRRVDCAHHPEPRTVWPVRIRAGALAPGVPGRDLWLSPDHALLLDGVLIPVKYLINGSTVAQVSVGTITYYHVELRPHDAVLAEGAAAETYLDTGTRAYFGASGAGAADAEFATRVREAEGCAPLLVTGPQVQAVRRRLIARASVHFSRAPERPVSDTTPPDAPASGDGPIATRAATAPRSRRTAGARTARR
ncbi:MAG TPA: Hint domain-containing protein [Acetobacteraceae bacterium]|nr:Hint domain-containing protein [Acetobacteraceae bacterium]